MLISMGAETSCNQYYASDSESSTDNEDHLSDSETILKECHLTNDALGAASVSKLTISQPANTITIETVIEMEKLLDFYEKVSLVFLLYDDADVALQYLLNVQQGAHINVVEEWAIYSAKLENWQDKLLEAMCLVQNFNIIFKLGLEKKEVCERFLPYNGETSLYVDIIKKKLYRMCENFTDEETSEFINLVRRDILEKKLPFKEFDNLYLEMYFLHWITIKYVSYSDFTNICKALKAMDLLEEADSLRKLHVVKNRETSRERDGEINKGQYSKVAEINESERIEESLYDKSLSSSSLFSQSSIQHDRIIKRSYEDNSYYVDPEHPGKVLIINQKDFYTEFDESLKHLLPETDKKLENRDGTDCDRDKLEATFKKFGFEVVAMDNLSHLEMKDEIKKIANSITVHSSLIICILSHGIEGKVYGNNSIPMEVREIQTLMCRTNVANLKMKPKILILQACQGTECQPVIEDDEEAESDLQIDGPGGAVPRTADMLVFWPTVPGFSAVRDKKRGTWFIQSLCDAILENAQKMHFEDICVLVKHEIIFNKRWTVNKVPRAMVPIKESTLSKFFFLPPARS